MQSLADVLRVPDPKEPDKLFQPMPAEDITVEIFCRRVLESEEFRSYLMNGIILGDLPPAIVTRIMDYGWGAPPKRLEIAGKDGGPIEVVTEIRRVIVRPSLEDFQHSTTSDTTH